MAYTKKTLFAPYLSAVAAIVLIATALAAPARANTEGLATERQAIQQGRAAIEAEYTRATADCRQRFAVTDCTQKADRARREGLADLRRQEQLLEQRRRREAGAQAQSRIDAKREAQQEKLEQRAAPAP